jgi:hypothetical protein
MVAKLHRKDRVEYYQEAQAEHPHSKLIVVPDGDRRTPDNILDWLQGCSALVTVTSMTAVEAMLMRVSVITVDLADEIREVDFIDAGTTLHARNEEELEAALDRVFDAPESLGEIRAAAERYARETFFALDGRSAERAAQTLLTLKEEAKTGT